jgi:ubiquinone/menaquinone biosynthesis C-methylase UbiE
MKNLNNWDKKTWLSSEAYISNLIYFLKKKINFNKKTRILDVGCGRGKIISNLSKEYQMSNLPLGIDIIKHKDVAKRIRFTKSNALKYLEKTNEVFDLILFKQSIHFFKFLEIKKILRISKNRLAPKGKIIIFALHPKKNYWPTFRMFKFKLIKSLKKDETIYKLIKFSFTKYKINYFSFKVKITKDLYLQMIKNRFNSCLLNFSLKELKKGIEEINHRYKKELTFFDKLICITYEKK